MNDNNCRVCFGYWYFTWSLCSLVKYLEPKTNPPVLHNDLQLDIARLLLSNYCGMFFISLFHRIYLTKA